MYYISISKGCFVLFQRVNSKFYCFFRNMKFWSKIITLGIRSLILSTDSPLDFQAKFVPVSPVSTLNLLEKCWHLNHFVIYHYQSVSFDLNQTYEVLLFALSIFYQLHLEQCLLDIYLQGVLFLV